jgi:hypothetical protein
MLSCARNGNGIHQTQVVQVLTQEHWSTMFVEKGLFSGLRPPVRLRKVRHGVVIRITSEARFPGVEVGEALTVCVYYMVERSVCNFKLEVIRVCHSILDGAGYQGTKHCLATPSLGAEDLDFRGDARLGGVESF